jgi:hypothetical protein
MPIQIFFALVKVMETAVGAGRRGRGPANSRYSRHSGHDEDLLEVGREGYTATDRPAEDRQSHDSHGSESKVLLRDFFVGAPDRCERLISCIQYCTQYDELIREEVTSDRLYSVIQHSCECLQKWF